MQYRGKLIALLIVVFLLSVLQVVLPGHPGMVDLYGSYVFRPYQSFRNLLLGNVSFSIGDILYLSAFIALIALVVRWIYFAFRLRKYKHALAHSAVNFLITVITVYIFFFLGWGGNYYKPSLTEYWSLGQYVQRKDTSLWQFDSLLVSRLNGLSRSYRPLHYQEVNERTQYYYRIYTDSKTRLYGLNIKKSLFGAAMGYFRIQGYYNPFTGEAQVNHTLPSFMLPFVVSHELAHQSGIASEEDANLLAFALGTTTSDTVFQYSSYFNIWLYTNSLLYRVDSNRANALRDRLNGLTVMHLDSLRAFRRRYQSGLSHYSSALYDSYLRLHNQKDGIMSYNNVAWTAWAWERKNKQTAHALIQIP